MTTIGEEILGFTALDIALQSIRSGGAMAMFLSGVSEIIIQRVGRWASMAFLEYIREQVDAFTAGVSDKMLQFESFHTLNQNEGTDAGNYTPVVNGDGEEKVPYTVHFSDMVLKDDDLDIEMKIKGMKQDS